MNYWILQMNPTKFLPDIDYSLLHREGELDWWGIEKYRKKVKEEDTVFVWHSIDKRNRAATKPRGIYAQGIVLSVWPNHSPDAQEKIIQLKQEDRPLWADSNERIKQETKPDILMKYSKTLKCPLTKDEIVNAGLGYIHIITYPNQGICSLSESDAAQIMKLLEDKSKIHKSATS